MQKNKSEQDKKMKYVLSWIMFYSLIPVIILGTLLICFLIISLLIQIVLSWGVL